jgi:uncharacterized membrane protein YbhN (UPF0104 family)
LTPLNISRRIRDLFFYYLIGAFYGFFLPGVIGGDLVRIGLCSIHKQRTTVVVAATVLMERTCGVIVLFIIGSIMIGVLPPEVLASLGSPIVTAIIASAALSLILVITFALVRTRIRANSSLHHETAGIFGKVIRIILLGTKLSFTRLTIIFGLTALFQISSILAVVAIAKALGISLPLAFFFVIFPVVYVSTVLPISLGGLGVREGILVLLMSKVGVLTSDAVALSF